MKNKSPVEKHFDKIAEKYDLGKKKNWYYYSHLKKLLIKLIPENKKVLEIGCGTGDLLMYLKPKHGWGMDISFKMIKIAKDKFKAKKDIIFSIYWPKDYYDYIFMSDVVEHLEDPVYIFKKISRLMTNDSIFICTMANPIWEPLLVIAEKLGLKMPEGVHHRRKFEALKKIMRNSGMKIINHDFELLIPIYVPLVSEILNKLFGNLLKRYAFIEYFIAKKC